MGVENYDFFKNKFFGKEKFNETNFTKSKKSFVEMLILRLVTKKIEFLF